MGYLADQKAEHEKACEAAIQAGDAATARMHAAKAADFCFALAKQPTGPVSTSYVNTAEGWLEIAERLATAKLTKRSATEGGARAGASAKRDAAEAATRNSGRIVPFFILTSFVLSFAIRHRRFHRR